jgi:Spy/CpxP family protein refolding chaperone
MKKRLAVLALAFAALASPIALAQDKAADTAEIQALRAAQKGDKRAYVEHELALTDAEAKRFWPIYDAYQRTLNETGQRRSVALESLMFRDKKMTNLAAKRLVTELMAIDDAESKARRTLRNRLMRALPPLKAARYLQIEDKMQAIRDYDIAANVPLIQ